MYLFWYKKKGDNNNFGDELNPYIIKKITGLKIKHLPIADSRYRRIARAFKKISKNQLSFTELLSLVCSLTVKHYYVGIGSVIEWVGGKNCHVWGAGLMNKNGHIKDMNFHAVRGEITRKKIVELGYNRPPTVGDPALLLPLIYTPKVDKKYRLGIIPHYVHYKEVSDRYKNDFIGDVLIIDLLDDIEIIVDQIFSCKKTISSSLHGVIVSHAYKIPSLWCKIGNESLAGDNVKFADYFSSVKIKPYREIEILNMKDILSESQIIFKEFADEANAIADIEELQKKLILNAPFKVLNKFR